MCILYMFLLAIVVISFIKYLISGIEYKLLNKIFNASIHYFENYAKYILQVIHVDIRILKWLKCWLNWFLNSVALYFIYLDLLLS